MDFENATIEAQRLAQRLMIEDLIRRNRGYHKAVLGLMGLLRDAKVPVAKTNELREKILSSANEENLPSAVAAYLIAKGARLAIEAFVTEWYRVEAVEGERPYGWDIAGIEKALLAETR